MRGQFEETEISAVAMVIMAHGGDFDEIKFSDGKKILLRSLIEPILNCGTLNGKPKIVVTQFCRGIRHLSGSRDDEETVQVDGDLPTRYNDQVKFFSVLIPQIEKKKRYFLISILA